MLGLKISVHNGGVVFFRNHLLVWMLVIQRVWFFVKVTRAIVILTNNKTLINFLLWTGFCESYPTFAVVKLYLFCHARFMIDHWSLCMEASGIAFVDLVVGFAFRIIQDFITPQNTHAFTVSLDQKQSLVLLVLGLWITPIQLYDYILRNSRQDLIPAKFGRFHWVPLLRQIANWTSKRYNPVIYPHANRSFWVHAATKAVVALLHSLSFSMWSSQMVAGNGPLSDLCCHRPN